MATDLPRTFIDVHAHYTPPEYVAALEELRGHPDAETARTAGVALDVLASYGSPLFTEIGLRHEGMAAAGVAHQVISYIGPPIAGGEDVQVLLADAYNTGLAAVCRADPERFSFVAKVPLTSPAAAVAAYERARADGALGAGLTLRHGGEWLGRDGLEPFFDALDADSALVVLHPAGELGDPCGWPRAAWPLGAPFEDTMATMLMVRDGVFGASPNVRWVVPHLGGALPFLYERLEEYAGLLGSDVRGLADLPNVYFDTANPQASALRLAVEVLGADRLLYGTDYPYAYRDLGPAATSQLVAGLHPADADKIASGTAAGLLRSAAGWANRGAEVASVPAPAAAGPSTTSTHRDIPVLDLGPYLATGDPGDLPRLIADNCTSTGFFQVVNHGVAPELLDAIYEVGERMWALPHEELAKAASPTGHPFRGAKPWVDERGAVKRYSLQNNLHDDAEAALAAGVPAAFAGWFEPNAWPVVDGLMEARTPAFDACRELGAAMMRLFALALGLDEHALDPYFTHDSSYFSMLHYPAGWEWEGATRTAEHSDSGVLTMLHQRGNYEGLELQHLDGEWTAVPVIDGALVINIGDLMSRWTNDTWRATRHRVVGRGPEAYRSSIAAFYLPNVDAVIEPLPTCLGDEPPKYGPITPYEWEAQFFEKRFGARRPDVALANARA